jgi:integrase
VHFLAFCVGAGLIAENPAEGVGVAKMARTGGFKPWTEADVDAYTKQFPIGTRQRLALALYLNFAVRKSDVVRIGPSHIKNGELTDFQPKKGSTTGGKQITVPLFAETLAIIKATPLTGTKTFIVTERGKPYTVDGFGKMMRRWCDEAGLPDIASHGLRKLCLIRMAEEGLNPWQIASISGHKNLKELERYCEEANRKKLARQAIAHMEKAKKAVS